MALSFSAMAATLVAEELASLCSSDGPSLSGGSVSAASCVFWWPAAGSAEHTASHSSWSLWSSRANERRLPKSWHLDQRSESLPPRPMLAIICSKTTQPPPTAQSQKKRQNPRSTRNEAEN